jgi:hypothetical protein
MDAWLPRPRGEVEMPEGMTPEQAARFRARMEAQGPPVVPIFKLMTPTAMPTRMLEEGR